MKSQGAVLYGADREEKEPFKVQEIEVDEPKAGEVLVHLAATGLCHSDWHAVTGDLPVYYPMVCGHEGAGVVEQVGEGVTETSGIEPGDHVILTFIPSCGRCRFCSQGLTMLCDLGAGILAGPQIDGSFRMHDSGGQDLGQFCMISTFSEYTVCPVASCVKITEDLPLDKVCLVGCGVPTGFGTAVNAADVQPGETAVVFGIGGVGINAIQGAAAKGATKVVAVDLVDFKLEMAEEMGATHTINASNENPVERIMELTNGVGADKAMITIDEVTAEHVGDASKCIRKAGRVVVTGLASPTVDHIDVNPLDMVLMQKEVVGSLYGNSNPRTDLLRYLELYRTGKLKVDELVTQTYTLDQINEGYKDMLEGRNIKGVINYGWM